MTLFIELAESASAGLIVASHDRPLMDRLGFERLSPRIEAGRYGAKYGLPITRLALADLIHE